MPQLSESIRVDAPAGVVYALVSDLPRMGEWSPECTAVSWRGDSARAAVGARFTGRNRDGWKRWSTTGRVVRAEPGRAFAFDTSMGPVPMARWAYLIEPEGSGCIVTEEWTDRRPAGLRSLLDLAFGVRRELNRANITMTLANLKAAAEAQPR